MSNKLKQLWIDDLRDPMRYLGPASKDVMWKYEAWDARSYLFSDEVASVLEVLYLDNHLDDDDITGEDLLAMVAFRTEMFPCLKTVYLHSSDDEAVARMLRNYGSLLEKENIQLVEAPYREKE